MRIPAELFNIYANNLFLIADETECSEDAGEMELQIAVMREGAQEIVNLKAQLKRERESLQRIADIRDAIVRDERGASWTILSDAISAAIHSEREKS